MPHLKEKGKLNKTNAFIDEQDVTFYRSAPWWRPGGMTQQTAESAAGTALDQKPG